MKINFKFKGDLVNNLLTLRNKSWIFTILVFLLIFGLAVFIWVECVFNPKPSQSALGNIVKAEKEYQSKIKEIKNNYQFLINRMDKFNNSDRQTKERRYFEPLDLSQFSFSEKNESQNLDSDLLQ